MVDARNIVNKCGMSERPGYYSGRGATISDLNSEKLGKIHQNIETLISKEAAQNFVKMVSEIPVLSATDFLLTLYNLERNNWKWDSKFLSDKKGNYFETEGEAFGTFASVIGGMKNRDESYEIRYDFLQEHLTEPSCKS